MNYETQKSSRERLTRERAEYREQLRDQAEAFLFHPALQELVVAAEAEGRVTEEDMTELIAAQDDLENYPDAIAKLVHKAMNWRHDPKMERHQLKDDDLSPEFRSAIKRIAAELSMTDAEPIPQGHYDVAAVLGATVGPVANRTDFLYDALEGGEATAQYVVGLGAERPMLAPDLKNADKYPYVRESLVETNLLSFAERDWFERNGYDLPHIDTHAPTTSLLRDANYDSRYQVQTVSFEASQHRPAWAPEVIVNLSAPYQKDHHPRANTGETIAFLSRLANLQPGNHALFISHQPYLLGQKFEIERMCLDDDLRVTVAGYEARVDPPATVWGGEIAKAVQKAQQLREALTQESVDLAA